MLKDRCDNAAKLLFISQNIGIKDSMFYRVNLGDDITVLITYDYLGKGNIDYVYDFAIVDGNPTMFIFADTLLNENVPRAVRVNRIYRLFNALIGIYEDYKFMIPGSIYEHIMLYAPMVMTVRLIETFYNRNFVISKDFNPSLYGDDFTVSWFDDDALEIIHSCDDTSLLDFGALVEHVSRARYATEVGEE